MPATIPLVVFGTWGVADGSNRDNPVRFCAAEAITGDSALSLEEPAYPSFGFDLPLRRVDFLHVGGRT